MPPAGKRHQLMASAHELTGLAVTLVDDMTFSNRAIVARLLLSTGATVVAKRHVTVDAYANEVEAMRHLPEHTRPALIAAGEGTVVMEELGTVPRSTCRSMLSRARIGPNAFCSPSTSIAVRPAGVTT